MTQKLYCYVDETGQDTKGDLFIVTVVVTGNERDALRRACEEIEQISGKGRRKWIKTRYKRRVAYIRQVFQRPIFRGKLYFALYRNQKDYLALTVQTVVSTLQTAVKSEYKATVLIDALPRSLERETGLQLRRRGIHAKVRGVKKDENDVLVRLADAVCGLVRAEIEEQPDMQYLFSQGVRRGFLTNVLER